MAVAVIVTMDAITGTTTEIIVELTTVGIVTVGTTAE